MNLIRNEKQATLNELLKMMKKSADHFDDLAMHFEQDAVADDLRDCFNTRKPLIHQLELAVREHDDLPAEPSTDQATVEKLAQRVQSTLAGNGLSIALQNRISAEQQLLETVSKAQSLDWTGQDEELIGTLQQHVRSTIEKLEALDENTR